MWQSSMYQLLVVHGKSPGEFVKKQWTVPKLSLHLSCRTCERPKLLVVVVLSSTLTFRVQTHSEQRSNIRVAEHPLLNPVLWKLYSRRLPALASRSCSECFSSWHWHRRNTTHDIVREWLSHRATLQRHLCASEPTLRVVPSKTALQSFSAREGRSKRNFASEAVTHLHLLLLLSSVPIVFGYKKQIQPLDQLLLTSEQIPSSHVEELSCPIHSVVVGSDAITLPPTTVRPYGRTAGTFAVLVL